MACPRCLSENIISAGFYITKIYKKRTKYKCKDCNRVFVVGKHLREITLKQENEIIRLSKKINPYASKFDNRGGILTYSVRQIEKITGVSHVTIDNILKDNKKSSKK